MTKPRGRRTLGAESRYVVLCAHAPAVGWSLALGLGFLAWIGATLVGIVRLVPRDEGPLRWRAAAPWAVGSLVALVAWLLGAGLA